MPLHSAGSRCRRSLAHCAAGPASGASGRSSFVGFRVLGFAQAGGREWPGWPGLAWVARVGLVLGSRVVGAAVGDVRGFELAGGAVVWWDVSCTSRHWGDQHTRFSVGFLPDGNLRSLGVVGRRMLGGQICFVVILLDHCPATGSARLLLVASLGRPRVWEFSWPLGAKGLFANQSIQHSPAQ